MFTEKDFAEIDGSYFDTLLKSCYHIILKSRNTEHVWDIYCRSSCLMKSIVVYHKHHEQDTFHEQPNMHPHSIEEAQRLIKKHDEDFLLHKDKKRPQLTSSPLEKGTQETNSKS